MNESPKPPSPSNVKPAQDDTRKGAVRIRTGLRAGVTVPKLDGASKGS
jgi:hypothetical protein